MQITLELFGAFRPFGDSLTLNLPENGRVSDIRPILKQRIDAKPGLIDSSRFATDTEILMEDHFLQDGARLAILPPVAGG